MQNALWILEKLVEAILTVALFGVGLCVFMGRFNLIGNFMGPMFAGGIFYIFIMFLDGLLQAVYGNEKDET